MLADSRPRTWLFHPPRRRFTRRLRLAEHWRRLARRARRGDREPRPSRSCARSGAGKSRRAIPGSLARRGRPNRAVGGERAATVRRAGDGDRRIGARRDGRRLRHDPVCRPAGASHRGGACGLERGADGRSRSDGDGDGAAWRDAAAILSRRSVLASAKDPTRLAQSSSPPSKAQATTRPVTSPRAAGRATRCSTSTPISRNVRARAGVGRLRGSQPRHLRRRGPLLQLSPRHASQGARLWPVGVDHRDELSRWPRKPGS